MADYSQARANPQRDVGRPQRAPLVPAERWWLRGLCGALGTSGADAGSSRHMSQSTAGKCRPAARNTVRNAVSKPALYLCKGIGPCPSVAAVSHSPMWALSGALSAKEAVRHRPAPSHGQRKAAETPPRGGGSPMQPNWFALMSAIVPHIDVLASPLRYASEYTGEYSMQHRTGLGA